LGTDGACSDGQLMLDLAHDGVRACQIPPPASEVLPGIAWGAFDQLFTPAFWFGRAWQLEHDGSLSNYRLGTTLAHEVAACLLGGYGIPAEVGIAAYARLRDHGVLETAPTIVELAKLLKEPLHVGGRSVRYRFAQRKAEQLAFGLEKIHSSAVDHLDDRELRDFLLDLHGIGPKTASWITRNWRDSDAVAILDVHIVRACVIARVFDPHADPARNYFALEDRFLEFASAIGVRASILDNLMWQTMRRLGPNAREMIRSDTLADDGGTNGNKRRRTTKARNNFVAKQAQAAEGQV
jgi:thermostable 8-oxoguanine DNA glycosylase